MYSWDDDTSSWYGRSSYAYSKSGAERRARAARRAAEAGGRTYERRSGPNERIIAPKKRVRSESKNPLIVAVDVTGSMASWPAEIFDRLPLLFRERAELIGGQKHRHLLVAWALTRPLACHHALLAPQRLSSSCRSFSRQREMRL